MRFAEVVVRIGSYAGICFLMAACSASKATNPDTDTIYFNGQIDAASVARFEQVLRSPSAEGARWIEITSAGGDAPAGFAMGHLIHDRGLSVRVKGYCVSACAQYVFLAGKFKSVEPKSLVLFHNTLGMIERLHRAAGEREGADAFVPVAKQETQFLHEIGVDTDLTALAMGGLGPVCITVNKQFAASDLKRYGYGSRVVAFGVSKQMIEGLAGPVQGYWPTDYPDMFHTLRILPFNRAFTVAWVSGVAIKSQMRPIAPALPFCPSMTVPRNR